MIDKFHLYKELEITTNTGSWEFDIATENLTWSDQTYRIHGLELGSSISVDKAIEFYHPEDRSIIEDHFQKCIREHQSYRLSLRIYDSIGDIKFVESFGKPVFDDNNELCGVFGTFKDITEEKAYFLEHEHYKKTLEDHFIIADTDKRGIITRVNDKFCEVSQYSEEELVGKPHSIVNSGYHSKEFFKELWDTINKGEPWEGEIRNKAKSGDIYWVQSFIFPLLDAKTDQVIGFRAFRYEITEKKANEEALRIDQESRLFTSQLAALGEISAGIGHEIANPLALIDMNSKLLMKLIKGDERLEKIQATIEKSTLRIQSITKGLYRLSQASRGDEYTSVKFDDILHETLDFCAEALKSDHIELKYEHILGSNLMLNCNQTKISQVILNLINNAKDAINEAGVEEKWIRIDLSDLGKTIKISVTDSGPGVPPELRDKVLASFFTTKAQGKGTGLGLPLIKRFVEEHDGTFYLDEKCGPSCFSFELPKK